MVRYVILHDHTSKKTKIESTPLYSTFKLKYRKNVKLTIFLNGNERESSKITIVRNILNSKLKSHIISNSTYCLTCVIFLLLCITSKKY